MIRIEIVSTDVSRMKGTSKKTGNAYDMAMQEAYLHTGGRYPDKFELSVPKDEQGAFMGPYQPGFYVPSDDSYQVRDGRFGINSFELRLVPETAEVTARAKAA
jgi:hypothetical protein